MFDMINARQEFLYAIGKRLVKCAHIIHKNDGIDANTEPILTESILKVGYTNEDYQIFLDSLNYEYEDGWGTQELYGNVWLTDNTWYSRGECDGSEWWEYHKCPDVSDGCNQEVEIPKEIDLSKKDVCVICGKDTPYTIETHIYNRIGYIEGTGQGCHNPIICSQDRAKSTFMISEALIHNTPNDTDLGYRIREIYWNHKNN